MLVIVACQARTGSVDRFRGPRVPLQLIRGKFSRCHRHHRIVVGQISSGLVSYKYSPLPTHARTLQTVQLLDTLALDNHNTPILLPHHIYHSCIDGWMTRCGLLQFNLPIKHSVVAHFSPTSRRIPRASAITIKQRPPRILFSHCEIYASTAVLGSTVYIASRAAGLPPGIPSCDLQLVSWFRLPHDFGLMGSDTYGDATFSSPS